METVETIDQFVRLSPFKFSNRTFPTKSLLPASPSHTAYSTTACSLEGRTSVPPPVSGAQLNPSLGFSTTTATATHSLLTGTDQAPPAKPFAFGRRGAKRSSQLLLLTQAKNWMRGGPRTMARRRHGGAIDTHQWSLLRLVCK